MLTVTGGPCIYFDGPAANGVSTLCHVGTVSGSHWSEWSLAGLSNVLSVFMNKCYPLLVVFCHKTQLWWFFEIEALIVVVFYNFLAGGRACMCRSCTCL